MSKRSASGGQAGHEPRETGLVVGHEGASFQVEAAGEVLDCGLRGRLRLGGRRASSPVVIGDRVELLRLPDGGGVIEAVQPRRSELARPGFAGVEQLLAANVDLLLIVQAAAEPPFQRRLAERFIGMARRGGVEPLVVVNKYDLADPALLQEETAPLQSAGDRVYFTSTVNGSGIDALREAVRGRIAVLSGKSGVGKSSLVNALYPGLGARVAKVSEWSHKGRHTTTSSRLYPVGEGTYLADTPGIRTLGLLEDDGESVADTFPEIAALAARCRFRNCTHTGEQQCAVRTAVDRGEIHPDRLRNFRRMRRRE
ncbi:MAG: ribosome small subunit-dependent GTPase A [Armatimonadota bacterium]